MAINRAKRTSPSRNPICLGLWWFLLMRYFDGVSRNPVTTAWRTGSWIVKSFLGLFKLPALLEEILLC